MSYRPKLAKLKRPVLTFLVMVLLAIGIKIAMSTHGDGIRKPKYKVEKELENYLSSFVDLARLKGIDLTYIYGQDITIKFSDFSHATNVATSYGRNKDKIIILVDKKRFYQRTEEGRKYVMFHELGHDVLNLRHLKKRNELGPDEDLPRGMMEATAYTGFFKNYDRFSAERQQNYLYKALNNMFDRYNNKEFHLFQNNNVNPDGIKDDKYKIVHVVDGETADIMVDGFRYT